VRDFSPEQIKLDAMELSFISSPTRALPISLSWRINSSVRNQRVAVAQDGSEQIKIDAVDGQEKADPRFSAFLRIVVTILQQIDGGPARQFASERTALEISA
jgi:hypothetical protein